MANFAASFMFGSTRAATRRCLCVKLRLGLIHCAASVVLRIIFFVCPKLGDVSHDFLGSESSGKSTFCIGPIPLRLAQFPRSGCDCVITG